MTILDDIGRRRQAVTREDLDWLRMMRAATDSKREALFAPTEIARKLRAFGFTTPNSRGGSEISDRGREALLEQDMRDAEDR